MVEVAKLLSAGGTVPCISARSMIDRETCERAEDCRLVFTKSSITFLPKVTVSTAVSLLSMFSQLV